MAADTIVTALPLEPDTTLLERFAGVAPDVRMIGDAADPGLVYHAIRAGARAGREV